MGQATQAQLRAARSHRVTCGAGLYTASSLTKVLTAIAVLQLAERDALQLDAPLSRYVRHPYGDDVSVRMLLAHTAGIPNPAPIDWFFVEGRPVQRDAALARVLREHAELEAEPGEEYRYGRLGN